MKLVDLENALATAGTPFIAGKEPTSADYTVYQEVVKNNEDQTDSTPLALAWFEMVKKSDEETMKSWPQTYVAQE